MYIQPAEAEAEAKRFNVHTNEKHPHSIIQICFRLLYKLLVEIIHIYIHPAKAERSVVHTNEKNPHFVVQICEISL